MTTELNRQNYRSLLKKEAQVCNKNSTFHFKGYQPNYNFSDGTGRARPQPSIFQESDKDILEYLKERFTLPSTVNDVNSQWDRLKAYFKDLFNVYHQEDDSSSTAEETYLSQPCINDEPIRHPYTNHYHPQMSVTSNTRGFFKARYKNKENINEYIPDVVQWLKGRHIDKLDSFGGFINKHPKKHEFIIVVSAKFNNSDNEEITNLIKKYLCRDSKSRKKFIDDLNDDISIESHYLNIT